MVKENRKKITIIGMIILLFVIFGVVLMEGVEINLFNDTDETTPEPTFTEVSVHDPSIIKDIDNDMYYVFGTHITGAKSKDLLNWSSFTNGYSSIKNTLYDDLTENLSESFEWAGMDDADSYGGYAVWAPEVFWNEHFVNEDGTKGAYLIYYSASSTYMRSAIGVASSKNIEGPYKYVDTVVYSGFETNDSFDGNSEVNKHWENTNVSQLIAENIIEEPNNNWFSSVGAYNNGEYPNAIDPNILYDTDGTLWMIYGSWSGGIFALELDEKTGTPIYPGVDSFTDDNRMIDRYFGTKIAAGYGRSAEGPYVHYDAEQDNYYLFLTYGGLNADGGYQVRNFRSENIDGPYVDILGNDAVLSEEFDRGIGNFPGTVDHMEIGNKIIGNFLFNHDVSANTKGGYQAPGHNSVYRDEEKDQLFLVFHTRFPNKGENHEVRIHQMVMNNHGWPVVTPHRYSEVDNLQVDANDIKGKYSYINHGKDIGALANESNNISLRNLGIITGSETGRWEMLDDNKIKLSINGETYEGIVMKQWDPYLKKNTVVFTALSDKGISIWGSKY